MPFNQKSGFPTGKQGFQSVNQSQGLFSNSPEFSINSPGGSSNGQGFPTNSPGGSSNGQGFPTNSPGGSSIGQGFPTNSSGGSSIGQGFPTNSSGGSSNGQGFSTNSPEYSSNGQGYNSGGQVQKSDGRGYNSGGQVSNSGGHVQKSDGRGYNSGGQVSNYGGQVQKSDGRGYNSGGQVSNSGGHVQKSDGRGYNSGGQVSNYGGQVQKSDGRGYNSGGQVSNSGGQGFPMCRYAPAVLSYTPSMGWMVDYYVLNPITNSYERKRIRLNRMRRRYAKVSDFKREANQLVCSINAKLAGGWTPFGESVNSRYYTLLGDMMTAYIAEKEKELKPDTLRSYKSFCNIFGSWCERVVPRCQCILFNRVLAVRYMDYVYNERKVSARGYNNQLKLARALFAWAVQKCYVKENPFEVMKTKREQEKKRVLIPAEVRTRMREYFEDVLPPFVAVMELVFTSLLRPKEISRVQVGQVFLDQHYIYMPGDKTKNGHARYAFLSDELCERLRVIMKGAKPTDYLFSVGYKPGKERMDNHRYVKDWDFMRKALKLPMEMQLYSLRDTGINNMLKAGIDPLSVMQAADHHDLRMTTRYANHADPNLMRTLQEQAPGF